MGKLTALPETSICIWGGTKLEFSERWTKRAKEGRVRQEKRGTRKGREEEGGRRREGRGQTL